MYEKQERDATFLRPRNLILLMKKKPKTDHFKSSILPFGAGSEGKNSLKSEAFCIATCPR